MRVVGADELTARAGASGTRWGATGDDEAWRETVRAHLAAEGSVLRRALVDRVLRWHDAPDDDATRGRVNDLIDALDGVGDVRGGRGLAGATRCARPSWGAAGSCSCWGASRPRCWRRRCPRRRLREVGCVGCSSGDSGTRRSPARWTRSAAA